MLGLLTGSWGILRAPSLELAIQWPEEKGQFFPVLVTQDLCGRRATQRPGEARITRRHLGQCPLQAMVDYWCISPSCLGLWGRVQTALLVFALIKRMRVNEAECEASKCPCPVTKLVNMSPCMHGKSQSVGVAVHFAGEEMILWWRSFHEGRHRCGKDLLRLIESGSLVKDTAVF